ncbi:hypothetical protein BDP55DRAFT_197406 [Colletotrichum godetiae]|uniref:Uncharacterized protein n=1 Tax=Colletotrichum godetiae TaxID=1209918 RepID=A0AAJ0AI68_9PEZI|nr:uncharacterized protein BDP55DRAFT_197406 [Colletotrichum godetiae]KAK1673715.1 hypothetical protein BDP55DRAFT_197406 [Colletotrichum godetiae]
MQHQPHRHYVTPSQPGIYTSFQRRRQPPHEILPVLSVPPYPNPKLTPVLPDPLSLSLSLSLLSFCPALMSLSGLPSPSPRISAVVLNMWSKIHPANARCLRITHQVF